MLLWPPVRDVGSGSILTWGRVWGAARPNVTFGTNKKLSIKIGCCPYTPGCYPDMVPAASPWALAAILTWRWLLPPSSDLGQGLGCGQA